jgi:hypothetical protein
LEFIESPKALPVKSMTGAKILVVCLSIGKYFMYPCAFEKNSLAFCGARLI